MIFNFDKLVANLNGILVGQYLIRSNLQLTNDDLSGIQQGDKHLYAIIDRLQTNNQTKSDSKFILRNNVLFKESIIYDQVIYRLCLPQFLALEVLTKLHFRNSAHLNSENLKTQFSNNFYTPNCQDLIANLEKTCIVCRLNRNPKA